MTRPAQVQAAVVSGVLAIVLGACSADVAERGGVGAGCDEAYAQAMAVDPASDTVQAVDGAIATCSSLEAWVGAARRYPDTTAGQDPVAYAVTRCAASQDLARSAVCLGLPGQSTP